MYDYVRNSLQIGASGIKNRVLTASPIILLLHSCQAGGGRERRLLPPSPKEKLDQFQLLERNLDLMVGGGGGKGGKAEVEDSS